MKRRHEMPFGAEVRDDGSVRFRLWAPAARQVDVCLEGCGPILAGPLSMEPCEGGWFELTTDGAGPGNQYRFQIDGADKVPDPASRFQTCDVHGPSEVIDPAAFEWQGNAWRGRRWEEAVLYEIHVGTFTRAGTFSGVVERLDYLASLGVTALELMPVSDFPGKRNWGYDGVFPFAPDSSYGRPEDLKTLVQAAHERGIMVLLDVVYNHFGPEGNYLRAYAPQFFTDRHRSPWGDGINFDGTESHAVRDFFIHNALYWLHEYHFDGLRLDAVHAITDDSRPEILTDLAEVVRDSVAPDRYIHLILENERNQARYLQRNENCQPSAYTAQWDDDIHHALHVMLTDETDGYYSDYAKRPLEQLGRCLVSGFAYQGEPSAHRNGANRGEPTAGLPPGAFLSFLQNHDQIGNRAFGERITKIADPAAVRAAVAILLLAPSPPLLFMGEEFAADTPFLFFCDFEKDLAAAVTAGRRNEFAHFAAFTDPAARERIPDPNSVKTFEACRLNWDSIEQPSHRDWLRFYAQLLKLRCQHVVPRLSGCEIPAAYQLGPDRTLNACWHFQDGSSLMLLANLGPDRVSETTPPSGQIIFASQHIEEVSHQDSSEDAVSDLLKHGDLPPWFVTWSLKS